MSFHYLCQGYLRRGTNICPSNAIPVAWADGVVITALQAALAAPGKLELLEERIRQRIEARRKTDTLDPRTVQQRIAEIDRRIANYYTAIGEGMDLKICREHIDKLKARRIELEQTADLSTQEHLYERALKESLSALYRLGSTLKTEFQALPIGLRRKVVQHFVSRIEVHQRDTFRVFIRIPIDDRALKRLTSEIEKPGANAESEYNSSYLQGRVRIDPHGVELGA
jgi:hypothetical protein